MRRVLLAVPALVAVVAASVPGVAAAAPAGHRAHPAGTTSASASSEPRAHARAKADHDPGSFVPLTQFRAVAPGTPLAAGHRLTVALAGRHGVPADAAAVAITVHALAPSKDGWLAVVPHGTSRSRSIEVSYRSGQDSAQPTVARLAHGAVDVLNQARAGSTRIAVDVAGYYAGGRVGRSLPGELHTLPVPTRALDTRAGTPIRAHGVRTFRVGHGVPSSGVGAVAVALTTFAAAARWVADRVRERQRSADLADGVLRGAPLVDDLRLGADRQLGRRSASPAPPADPSTSRWTSSAGPIPASPARPVRCSRASRTAWWTTVRSWPGAPAPCASPASAACR